MSAFLAAALVVGACSDETPRPAPDSAPSVAPGAAADAPVGRQVWGFALPAVGTTDEALVDTYATALDAVLDELTPPVDDVRVVRPTAASFRRDMLRFLAEQGAAYVCSLGSGSGADIAPIAADHPATDFCVVGDDVEAPASNVVVVDVRFEEAAYLAGIAAAASAVAAGAEEPTLGFVAGTPTRHTEGQRVAFTNGARELIPDVRIVSEFIGKIPSADQRDVTAGRVATQYLGGAMAVFVASDVNASRAVEVAREADRPIVGLAPALLDALLEDDPPPVLLAARPRLQAALVLVVSLRLEGAGGVSSSLGIADGAVEVVPGVADRYAAVAAEVEEYLGRFTSGDLVVGRG